MSPNVTLNYGARWEPWFPQNSEDEAFYSFDAERMRAGTRSTVYPQAPAGLYYPGDAGFPGKTGMRTVWSNIAPRVGVSWDPEGRRPHVAARGIRPDRRFRDRPVLLRFALGAALRAGTAPHRRAARRSVGLGRPDQSRIPVAVGGANYPVQRRRCTRCSSRCRTTSRRRATTAGTSRFSSRLATTWRSRRPTSATAWSTSGASSTATRRVPPAGVTATGPCTLRLPSGGITDVRQLLRGTARSAA